MYITPNPIAWLVLLSWPLVTYLFFRKMTPDRALIWTVLGAYMLLPPLLKIDLPVVPDVTKDSMPGLLGVAMASRRSASLISSSRFVQSLFTSMQRNCSRASARSLIQRIPPQSKRWAMT